VQLAVSFMLDVFEERCSLAKHVAARQRQQTAKPFTGHTALRHPLTSGHVLSLPNLSQESRENTMQCMSL
jgi:hypothetical protein